MINDSGRNRPAIDYTLNLLGIRVWTDACVLIARSGAEWKQLGAPRPLPFAPGAFRVADELCMTVVQYQLEHPQSDLVAILRGQKPFPELETAASHTGAATST